MNIRTMAAGSVLAAGLGTAGILWAATASAAGFAVDIGGADSFNVGTGATAEVNQGDIGVAISVFKPASVGSGGSTSGNNLFAIDGTAYATGNSSGNNLVAINGHTAVHNDAHRNNVVSLAGESTAIDAAGTNIINVGGHVWDSGSTSATSVSVCGTSLSGQADHITVSSGTCG